MSNTSKHLFLFGFLPVFAVAMFMLDISNAEAIPAYARKYQANCALCHNNVPRLAPFGQIFLENGYQFPGTTDGDDTAKIKLDGAQGPVTLDQISNMMAVRLRADIQKASFKDITDDMQGEGVDERWSVELPKIVNFFLVAQLPKISVILWRPSTTPWKRMVVKPQ